MSSTGFAGDVNVDVVDGWRRLHREGRSKAATAGGGGGRGDNCSTSFLAAPRAPRCAFSAFCDSTARFAVLEAEDDDVDVDDDEVGYGRLGIDLSGEAQEESKKSPCTMLFPPITRSTLDPVW